MNRRGIYAVLSGLAAILVFSGCGNVKEELLGPDKSHANLTGDQRMIVSDMSASTNSKHDAGIASLTAIGYEPLEVNQRGEAYTVPFVVCGEVVVDDCQRQVKPMSELPYVVFDLAGKPADNEFNFAGSSHLLYPAGPTQHESYSVRCDAAAMKTEASAVTGFSPATVAEMAELGTHVADRVAPIEKHFDDQPTVEIALTSGNVYTCVLTYEVAGALR